MKTVVVMLATIVLLAVAWFWWRADTLGDAPEVRAAGAAPLPVVTGPYDHVATECVDATAWESVHARPWQALSQQYEGAVDVCAEVYRVTAGGDDAGDRYLAVVTSAWSTSGRSDYWWPWEGREDAPDPIAIEVELGSTALAGTAVASAPVRGDCVTEARSTAVSLSDDAVGTTPAFVAGTCAGEISLGASSEAGATWVVARPEEWDLVATSYAFTLPAGQRPDLLLTVDRIGVEG